MKKNLKFLPLFALLFSGCAASVTIDRLPELVNPSNYLSTVNVKFNLEYDNYLFPDDHFIVNGKMNSILSISMYDNYAAFIGSGSANLSYDNTTSASGLLGNTNSSYYIFHKDGYTYELSDYKGDMNGETDEDKSGVKTSQSTAEFQTFMDEQSKNLVDTYWNTVKSIYDDAMELDLDDLNKEFIFKFDEGFNFTKKGDVYTAMAEGHHDNYGVLQLIFSFTIKSGVITKCVANTSVIKNNKVTARVTEEIVLNFTDKLKSYSGVLPNINDYDFN